MVKLKIIIIIVVIVIIIIINEFEKINIITIEKKP
jgi:hypothetical protein